MTASFRRGRQTDSPPGKAILQIASKRIDLFSARAALQFSCRAILQIALKRIDLFSARAAYNFALHSCSKGFTLVELVAVIALISLMLFFTMPNFQSAMGDQESKKASRRLMATIQELKEKALAERKLYVLHINLDAGRMWESGEVLSEESPPEKQDQGYEFPEGLKILDVEYPVKGKVSIGVADICFYKDGYSDKALIHIEDEDNEQMTFLVEPFLSKIKIYDSYANFED